MARRGGFFRRRTKRRGTTSAGAGLIALAVISLAVYFAFTKANPFASPYKLEAIFADAAGMDPNSPVRIAGVEVGKVTKVESTGPDGYAKVTMEIVEAGLPIHEDAQLKIRPRIFLECNFFVDINPGTPSGPVLESGAKPIPLAQTSQPVQFGEVLSVLETDPRRNLRTFLAEFSLKGLGGGGAQAFNRAAPFFAPAYRSSALVNEALLGVQPDRDLQRVLKGQQGVAAALTVDEESLKDLVTNLNTTAEALASEDDSLRATFPALRDTLRVGTPALASLDAALPALSGFANDALPGVRSSDETIDDALPFLRQARALVRPSELGGVAAELRTQIPRLVRLNRRLPSFLREGRRLGSCTNRVLVPFFETRIPSGEDENTGQLAREQIQRSFVGLAGESRTNDANTPFFRIQAVPPSNLSGPAGEVQPVAPSNSNVPPPHRPDVPCETQEPPNLSAPEASASSGGTGAPTLPSAEVLRKRADRLERAVAKAREDSKRKERPRP